MFQIRRRPVKASLLENIFTMISIAHGVPPDPRRDPQFPSGSHDPADGGHCTLMAVSLSREDAMPFDPVIRRLHPDAHGDDDSAIAAPMRPAPFAI
jgi:hypothetical protein